MSIANLIEVPDTDQLLREVEKQRALMIAVSTGGPRLEDVNPEYAKRHRAISNELSRLGLENPVPYTDLWEWYGKWSSGDLPTYQSRRTYISELLAPLVRSLTAPPASGALETIEPTGWTRVDRALGKMREQLASATDEEDYQAVGLLGRELFVSLAQAVYDPNIHPPTDDTKPSDTDAKRMLDAVIASQLGGKSNETPRRYAKSALALANELVHKRTAEFQLAALCAEATASTINIIAIITGQRDP